MRGKAVRRVLAGTAVLLGLLAGSGAAAQPLVLFDEGHGQAFLAGRAGDLDLSGLAAALRAAGAAVRTSTGRLDDAALAPADALVISGAFAPLAPAEVAALLRFLERGGRVAVMLHVAPPVAPLLTALGLQYSRAPLHDPDAALNRTGTDFTVSRFERHRLTEGLDRFAVFGCFGVRSAGPGARVLAGTGPRAWPDTDADGRPSGSEPVGVHGVLVAGSRGRGEFAVFGDDAIFQNRFLVAHNRALAERLARWLAGPAGPPPPRTIPL